MSWVETISRMLFATLAILAIVSLIADRDQGNAIGMPVSLECVAFCIIAASVTVIACARAWRRFPAPLLAGVVAGFVGRIAAGKFATPYGAFMGLFVGVFIVAIMPPRCHRPHAEAAAKSADDRT